MRRMQCARAILVTWLGSGSWQAQPSRLNTNEWMNTNSLHIHLCYWKWNIIKARDFFCWKCVRTCIVCHADWTVSDVSNSGSLNAFNILTYCLDVRVTLLTVKKSLCYYWPIVTNSDMAQDTITFTEHSGCLFSLPGLTSNEECILCFVWYQASTIV